MERLERHHLYPAGKQEPATVHPLQVECEVQVAPCARTRARILLMGGTTLRPVWILLGLLLIVTAVGWIILGRWAFASGQPRSMAVALRGPTIFAVETPHPCTAPQVEKAKLVALLPGGKTRVLWRFHVFENAVSVSSDGRWLAYVSGGQAARLVDLRTDRFVAVKGSETDFSPDSKYLALGPGVGAYRLDTGRRYWGGNRLGWVGATYWSRRGDKLAWTWPSQPAGWFPRGFGIARATQPRHYMVLRVHARGILSDPAWA